MKVIGTTKNGFLLDATDDEVARLVGYHSMYTLRSAKGRSYSGEVINVGDQLNISAMYDSLTQISNKLKTMEDARAMLRAVAASMELVDPLIREISDAVKVEGTKSL